MISDDNQKISVITGNILYVFGPCEHHSELTEEINITLKPTPNEDTLRD